MLINSLKHVTELQKLHKSIKNAKRGRVSTIATQQHITKTYSGREYRVTEWHTQPYMTNMRTKVSFVSVPGTRMMGGKATELTCYPQSLSLKCYELRISIGSLARFSGDVTTSSPTSDSIIFREPSQ